MAQSDLRRVTGYQDFVDEAPMDLVYVADHRRVAMVPVAQREAYAGAASCRGLILPCASRSLPTTDHNHFFHE